MISAIVLIGLLLNINSLSAQKEKLHAQPTFIRLKGETEVKEVIVPLRDSLNSVNLSVTSSIRTGELTIEIFDPTGEKYGNFTLGYQTNNSVSLKKENQKITTQDIDNGDEKAHGNLFRTIKNPVRGAWKARITNKGAVGNILIQFMNQPTTIKSVGIMYKIN